MRRAAILLAGVAVCWVRTEFISPVAVNEADWAAAGVISTSAKSRVNTVAIKTRRSWTAGYVDMDYLSVDASSALVNNA